MPREAKMRETTEQQFKSIIEILNLHLRPEVRTYQYIKLIAKHNEHNQRVYAIVIYDENSEDYAVLTAWGQVSAVKRSAVSLLRRMGSRYEGLFEASTPNRNNRTKGNLLVHKYYVRNMWAVVSNSADRIERI